jgi:hypothetical protein
MENLSVRSKKNSKTGSHSTGSHSTGSHSAHRQQSPVALRVLAHLLQRHPFAFWGAMAIIPLMTAGFAVGMLLSPGYSQQALTSQTQEQPVQKSPSLSQLEYRRDNSLSLWSLGTIALGCAVGTMGVARLLNRPSKPRRLTSGAIGIKPTVMRTALTHSKPVPLSPPEAAQPPSFTIQTRSRSSTSVASPTAEPTVTVVPPEETHPLDWDDNSLVNLMDIRKRRPLSSWL